jgi:hypothetical protein
VERQLQEYQDQYTGVAATVTHAVQDVASTMAETAGTVATTAREMAGSAVGAVTDTITGTGTYVREKG